MANYKADENIIRQLTDEDRHALLEIYLHRCLDEELLYRFFYAPVDIKRAYASERVQLMQSYRLLDSVDYAQPYPALFLTTLGVETVKALYGDELYQLYKPADGRGRLPHSAELKMNPKIIAHQMKLNTFALQFESYAKPLGYFCYYDEKFMPPASQFMMPDGMVELSNCYVFLEMDMGTEPSSRLAQKWNSYRLFLNSPGFFYEEKPIVMLFILENLKAPEVRRRNVTSLLLQHIGDRVNGQFEVYVNTPEVLHSIIKTQLLSQNSSLFAETNTICADVQTTHCFSVTRPSFLDKLDGPYSYYIRKLNEHKKIQVIGGRPQEFVMDIWLDGRLSTLRNYLYQEKMTQKTKQLAGRPIPYLIVIPNERSALSIIKMTKCPQPPNLYFTTPARLSACVWYEALFCIDQLSNLAHFEDSSLSSTVHEKRMSKL